jgi:myo-inositol-1(or 4)-monophosphatase
MTMDLQRITEIAIGMAQEAGALALAEFGEHKGFLKHDGSLVTEADGRCEALIRRRLQRHFPDHSMFGEEMGFAGAEDNPWVWYLDPIDGTSNYIFGLPTWGASVGLAHEGRPAAGAIFIPPTGRTYWAWRGGGAYCNGRRMAVHDPDEMRPTDLVCVSSTLFERYELNCPQKLRCFGCAAEALATMAAGSFAALVHEHWHLHDLAAGLLMCQEAGAVVTLEDGTPFESFDGVDPKGMAPLLVVAGPRIHKEILAAVRRK